MNNEHSCVLLQVVKSQPLLPFVGRRFTKESNHRERYAKEKLDRNEKGEQQIFVEENTQPVVTLGPQNHLNRKWSTVKSKEENQNISPDKEKEMETGRHRNSRESKKP